MKLYYIEDLKCYVHRQSDIPKGALFEVRDIPTDQAGLMAHLNDLEDRHQRALGDALPRVDEEPVRAAIERAKAILDAPAVDTTLRDCDIEDHIHNASPERLAVLSQAVCWRIKELSNGCNMASGAEAPTGKPPAQGTDGKSLAQA